jgi:hypothetical protein
MPKAFRIRFSVAPLSPAFAPHVNEFAEPPSKLENNHGLD